MSVSYLQTGESPRLLIHAGTHGDESESIDLVTECIEKYKKDLPPLIYVPEVSPSAVAARTRTNMHGNDLNRIFYSDSQDEEVEENIELFQKGPYDLFISFHEDPEFNEYYIYDTSYSLKPTSLVINHNQFLKTHNIPLLNGVDDPSDPKLGYEFIDGYKKFQHANNETDNGMILVWALNHNLIKHCLLPEIPGNADIKNKRFIVESFFSQVIIPFFSK